MAIQRLAASAALLALVALPSASAQTFVASNTVSTVPPVAVESSDRLVEALTSEVIAVRRTALLEVLASARAGDASLDAASVTPLLLAIYASDVDVSSRQMAVQALHAIGDRTAMQRVRDLLPAQRDESVQILTIGALVDTFGVDSFEGDTEFGLLVRRLRESR